MRGKTYAEGQITEFSRKLRVGRASSACPIKGAWNQDGKGLSNWDVFCPRPRAAWNGQTGEVACDHYHRYKEDVGLLKSLG
jgi:beta-glucosidase